MKPSEIIINGMTYHLHQCYDNFYDWCRCSSVGWFTYFYDNIVYHAENGCFAADPATPHLCVRI